MKLLRSYILREHIAPFVVTLSGLTMALLVGNIIKFAELVIARGVSPFDILRLLIYLVPYMISFTIPMACLIAMVMAFGRLNTDFELIAIRASGIAPMRLAAPLLTVALVISGLMLVMNDRVVPAAHLAFRRQLKTIGLKQPAAYLESGTFIKEFSPYILFLYQIEGRNLYHVRIYEPKPNGPTRTIVASRGEFEATRDQKGVQMKLFDGTIDEWDPEHPGQLYKVSFGSYSMVLTSESASRGKIEKKLKEMTFRELQQEREDLRAQGVDVLPISIELHRKIASAFAAFVFVLLGLALTLQPPRHERMMIFVWVLAIFLGYYLLMITINAVALKGWVSPMVAMWIPNAVGLLLGTVLLSRAVRS